MTLKEIAKLAGVSPAAISLVLNNKPGVGDKKREEIQALLRQYQYVPTRRTKQPASGNLIFLKHIRNGLLVEENVGFIAAIMDAVEAECRNLGYTLRIVVSNNNLEKSIAAIDFSSINGMFVLGTELDQSSYPILEKLSIPYIVIDNSMPALNCNTITMDNHEMVQEAVRHLSSFGFHEIGYFRSKMSIQNFEERAASFYQAADAFHLACPAGCEFLLEPETFSAYTSMVQYLSDGRRVPPCCFADNDTIAIGAMKALLEFHYRIPEDICIIGFDNIRFAAVNSPSLSTMEVNKKLIGQLAVKSLHSSIQDIGHRNVKIRVGGNVVARHSTSLQSSAD